MRHFPSGVAVLQNSTFSDENVCRTLLDLFNRPATASSLDVAGLGRGLTATQTATELVQTFAVAMEQLLLAERRGVLCRDDGPEGLIFYRNFFATSVL